MNNKKAFPVPNEASVINILGITLGKGTTGNKEKFLRTMKHFRYIKNN